MSRAFILLFVCVAIFSCSALKKDDPPRYNGVNLVSTPEIHDSTYCSALHSAHVNSVSIVPFAYGNSNNGHLTLKTDWQWWGESFEGSKEFALIAKKQGLQVMIKPQIWFDRGTYTGDVNLETEQKWANFESGYSTYILTHAENAQAINADILCIGTELKTFVLERPHYWKNLIKRVKEVYTGKITYAGNWDSYKLMPFWNELDYIGVDAYFPVSEEHTPTADSVANGWKPHINELKTISENHQKKILFCEYGYRSTDYPARAPWQSDRGGNINLEAQVQSYEGLFKSVWQEEFMAGGFLWKWYPDHSQAGGPNDNRFTPQNKPALATVKKYHSEFY